MNIILNRVKFIFTPDTIPKIYFSNDPSLLFSMKFERLCTYIEKSSWYDKFKSWPLFTEFKKDDFVYFDFVDLNIKGQFECDVIEYFKPKLIRSILVRQFEDRGLIVEPIPKFGDVSAYKFLNNYNAIWDVYQRYDFVIKKKFNELCISIGSNFSLISKNEIEYKSEYKSVRFLDKVSKNRILPFPKIGVGDSARLIANFEIKNEQNISDPFVKTQYRQKYDQIFQFYNDFVKGLTNSGLSFYTNGLINVNIRDAYKINMYENKMLFKNDKTDINPITGMRDYGIYKSSPKSLTNQFLFIYENKDDANNLYMYLKNGYKNFPGLERYVGVPVTLADIKGFQYGKTIDINQAYKEFEEKELVNNFYENIFAIVIGQFDKNKTTEERTSTYYEIKNCLLKKGIPSQFINQEHIRQTSSFNYHLPNIAIGILAKLGGIPWRLKNNVNSDLVIGFNQVKIDGCKFVGSSVFFTNEGYLKGIHAYPAADSEKEMIDHLRASIENYRSENGEIRRLIIHYYKPNSEKETDEIRSLLNDDLKINIPFAIIEVNDTKTQTDICFDADYNMGMPISGTYIKVGKDEYLLFNNTRYENRPLNTVKDELPIKIKIHYADSNGFSHSELIGQVYEFSRLIWKGLKQRSQPATTIYAKLIAEFSAHFEGDVPNNAITNTTPWFI
jgi:hypothetical protein